jgi:hypothetical protein
MASVASGLLVAMKPRDERPHSSFDCRTPTGFRWRARYSEVESDRRFQIGTASTATRRDMQATYPKSRISSYQ